MVDITKHMEAKSDQLNAIDLVAGPRILKITGVRQIAAEGQPQPIAIDYEGGEGRPYKPCKSMMRILGPIWGAEDCDKIYPGRSMQVYCEPTVKYGGKEVGGIRISHMSHMEKKVTITLRPARGVTLPFVVHPLVMDEQPSGPTAEEAQEAAEQAANGGKDVFNAWWKTPFGISCRPLLKSHMTKLGELIEAAGALPPSDERDDSDETPFPGDDVNG